MNSSTYGVLPFNAKEKSLGERSPTAHQQIGIKIHYIYTVFFPTAAMFGVCMPCTLGVLKWHSDSASTINSKQKEMAHHIVQAIQQTFDFTIHRPLKTVRALNKFTFYQEKTR